MTRSGSRRRKEPRSIESCRRRLFLPPTLPSSMRRTTVHSRWSPAIRSTTLVRHLDGSSFKRRKISHKSTKRYVSFVPFVAKISVCRLTDGPVRLARSRTRPFQGCNTGSNPVRDVQLHLKKRFGQHFLTDRSILQRI